MKLVRYAQIEAKDVPRYIEDPEWSMQQKLDGIRARLEPYDGYGKVLGSDGFMLRSTTAAPVVAKLYALSKMVRLPVDLEGEIIGESFYVFDCRSGQRLCWKDRYLLYQETVAELLNTYPINLSWLKAVPLAESPEAKAALWQTVLDQDLEGVVLKFNKGFIYDGTRTASVLKCKNTHTIDAVVTERGIGNGKNGTENWLSFGVYDAEGDLIELGRCSTIGKPFAAPGDVIELKYLYVGAGGKLVQPTHLRNRPDKEAEDCFADQLHFVSKGVLECYEPVEHLLL